MTENRLRLRLKTAILADGRTQEEIARAAGLHPTTLSLIVHGRLRATRDEEENISRVLKRPRWTLFSVVSPEELGYFLGSTQAEEFYMKRMTKPPEED